MLNRDRETVIRTAKKVDSWLNHIREEEGRKFGPDGQEVEFAQAAITILGQLREGTIYFSVDDAAPFHIQAISKVYPGRFQINQLLENGQKEVVSVDDNVSARIVALEVKPDVTIKDLNSSGLYALAALYTLHANTPPEQTGPDGNLILRVTRTNTKTQPSDVYFFPQPEELKVS